jgi:hypothetical protein
VVKEIDILPRVFKVACMAVGKTLVRLFFSHSRMVLSLASLYHHHRRINNGRNKQSPDLEKRTFLLTSKKTKCKYPSRSAATASALLLPNASSLVPQNHSPNRKVISYRPISLSLFLKHPFTNPALLKVQDELYKSLEELQVEFLK